MTDYNTSWVPDGYALTVSKKDFSTYYRSEHVKYYAHLANDEANDPLEIRYHILGDYISETTQPGFWGKLFGRTATTKEVFKPLVAEEELPTDAHVVNAFERLRGSYEKVKEFKDAEARVLGTYPPNTVKAIEK